MEDDVEVADEFGDRALLAMQKVGSFGFMTFYGTGATPQKPTVCAHDELVGWVGQGAVVLGYTRASVVRAGECIRKTCAETSAFRGNKLPTGEDWPDIVDGGCKPKQPVDWMIIECFNGKEGKPKANMPAQWLKVDNYRLVPNLVRTGMAMSVFVGTSSPDLSGEDSKSGR